MVKGHGVPSVVSRLGLILAPRFVVAAVALGCVLLVLRSWKKMKDPAYVANSQLLSAVNSVRRQSKGDHTYITRNGATKSFWHDVDLIPAALDTVSMVPFVLEIPRGTTAKMEINKATPHNPIIQDVKNGAPRFVSIPLPAGYGAIPQTYEHPDLVDELLPGSDPSSPLLGDGDPVDALDISSDLSLVHGESLNGTTGAVYAARVVGALAMIDGGEVDWKLMLVRPTDPVMGDVVDIAPYVSHCGRALGYSVGASTSLAGVQPVAEALLSESYAAIASRAPAVCGALAGVKHYLTEYKRVPGQIGPPPVTFGFSGGWLDAASAVEVVRRHHGHWCALWRTAGTLQLDADGDAADDRDRYASLCVEAQARTGATWHAVLSGEIRRVPPGVWPLTGSDKS